MRNLGLQTSAAFNFLTQAGLLFFQALYFHVQPGFFRPGCTASLANKRFHLVIIDICDLIRLGGRRRRIAIVGDIMIGFDHDTEDIRQQAQGSDMELGYKGKPVFE